MIALSGDRIIAAGLITATLALAACGSVNTVGTRSAPSTDVVSPLQSRINDALTDLYLHCTGARMSRTHGGPLQAQVDVANNDFRYRNFAYRFTWLGPNGNTIRDNPNSPPKKGPPYQGLRWWVRNPNTGKYGWTTDPKHPNIPSPIPRPYDNPYDDPWGPDAPAWPMSVWKPAVIASGGSMTLISIAPTDAARDFSLEIRRSD